MIWPHFLAWGQVKTYTSNIHIHDRSFPGVRSGEADTSNIHIHDGSFPGVESVASSKTYFKIYEGSPEDVQEDNTMIKEIEQTNKQWFETDTSFSSNPRHRTNKH